MARLIQGNALFVTIHTHRKIPSISLKTHGIYASAVILTRAVADTLSRDFPTVIIIRQKGNRTRQDRGKSFHAQAVTTLTHQTFPSLKNLIIQIYLFYVKNVMQRREFIISMQQGGCSKQ
jgi:hypothetical protein